MNETQQAEQLAAVLAGTQPSTVLDADVREALAVFRPDTAPALPVDADTLWLSIQPPLPAQNPDPVDLPSPANRSWMLALFGAGGMGMVGIAAAALLAFTATLGSRQSAPLSDVMAEPIAVEETAASKPKVSAPPPLANKTERVQVAKDRKARPRARPAPRPRPARSSPPPPPAAVPAREPIAEVRSDGFGMGPGAPMEPDDAALDAVAFADERVEEDTEEEALAFDLQDKQQEKKVAEESRREYQAAAASRAPVTIGRSAGADSSEPAEQAPSERNLDGLRRRAQRGTGSVSSDAITAVRAALAANDWARAMAQSTEAIDGSTSLEQQLLWVLQGDAHLQSGNTAAAERAWLRADAIRRDR